MCYLVNVKWINDKNPEEFEHFDGQKIKTLVARICFESTTTDLLWTKLWRIHILYTESSRIIRHRDHLEILGITEYGKIINNQLIISQCIARDNLVWKNKNSNTFRFLLHRFHVIHLIHLGSTTSLLLKRSSVFHISAWM